MSNESDNKTKLALLTTEVFGIGIALVGLLITADPTRQIVIALVFSASSPLAGISIALAQLRRIHTLSSRYDLVKAERATVRHQRLARAARRNLSDLAIACATLGALVYATKILATPYAPIAIAVAYVSNLLARSRPAKRRYGWKLVLAAILIALGVTAGVLGAMDVAETLEVPNLNASKQASTASKAEVEEPVECSVQNGHDYMIQKGDSLWLIARHELSKEDSDPSNAEIAALTFWIYEVNRESLPDSGNPDLILENELLEITRPGSASLPHCVT